jgi:radical SAM superfamily enzyme YgiQ (UPF0313 family)
MIAMSGVRAWSEELNAAGLTMPGIMERGAVIASLPSLGLLTLAGLTPPEIEVEYREIRDLRAEGGPAGAAATGALPTDYDLVAISSFTAQVLDAYRVADFYRARGVPVVMGGLHASVLPDEAAAHCTSVVVGEAEPLWPRVMADFLAGGLKPRYAAAAGEEFDFACSPMPRFDLLDVRKYNRLTVQTCRGCPHRCDFCASSILLTRKYKVKPVERIMAEVRRIREVWGAAERGGGPFIEFADDNSFINRAHARRLMEALREEGVHWFTETDVSIAEDEGLLDLMRDSGCREVLIGLESPRREGLEGVELRRNWKLRQLDRYEAAVRRIQSRGIAVNGCFVLGLDGDDESVFDAVEAFVERTGLFDVQVTVPTPFPGTPLYARLAREGRLLAPGRWERYTLFDVTVVPKRMSPQRLQRGLLELAARLYDGAAVRERRRRFFREADRRRIRPAMPRAAVEEAA